MTADRNAINHSPEKTTMDSIGQIDPFVVVAGLIVAILLASLGLWMLGGDKITSASLQNSPHSVSTAGLSA